MTPALTVVLDVPRPNLISVCAWHTPKAELDALNVLYPGRVTHTICASCAILFEQATA